MPASVSAVEKKEFVRWFLSKFELKRRECVWILNYMLSHDEILRHVHFVEEAHYCPRAMVMSVTDSSGIPFRFYKGNLMTSDAEKSFHDMRLNPKEPLYIQLNFPLFPPSPEYLAVLEENPHYPYKWQVEEGDKKLANDIVAKSVGEFQEEYLLKEIDRTLDNQDEKRFFELSKLLNDIKNQG
ncbi:ReoY family proteolytic degradation factor [Paenisporosarcina cavernae]|uniref:UPF0302 protein D3873_05675 n=1 Tax=Paenisporosarcina cavernae TaxID=2320858 RepID=A0A385YS17_9BACL|nr:ReoY family proteolytic degradation factor [Paenisporosarcina cavernae]AYC29396.1 YpiB family protein [Paenisporosarcina cavernae]